MYLKFQKADLLAMFINVMAWTSLSAFMITAKGKIGVDNISIFEFIIFASSIVGSYIAVMNFSNLKIIKYFDMLGETIFLIVIYYYIYNNDIVMCGITVYFIIIYNAVVRTILIEVMRNIEDHKYHRSNKILKKLRHRSRILNSIAGLLGTGIAVVAIKYMGMDILTFTSIMLIFNILTNIYDYYIVNKYL